MQTLGIDNLTAARSLPPEFIHAAAAVDVRSIGLFLTPLFGGAAAQRPLLTDKAMREETIRALRDHGVLCNQAEGFRLSPESSEASYRASLDVAVILGARFLNIVNIDPEPARARDNLSLLCALAGEYGLQPLLEFSPNTQVHGLADALALIESDPSMNLKLMLDTLHLERTGGTPDDIKRLPPGVVGYVQISDGPRGWPGAEAYRYESRNERAIPGTGQFPLKEILALVPQDDFIVSAEVPLSSLEQQGIGLGERIRRIVEGTRSLRDFA
jgi:sugar phosphate isomerase/epimerase